MLKKFKQAVKATLWHSANISAPLFTRRSNLSPYEARSILMANSPKPSGSVQCSNSIFPKRCDLQIIVPAYNASAYLAECMDSILNQETKYSIHVVLIDDGSTDDTPVIADSYQSDPRVTVIHQTNSGFSGARNTGLRQIFGTYITFIDSDDTICPGSIDALLNTAYAYEAEYVEAGMFEFYENKKEILYQYPCNYKVENPCEIFHGFAGGKIFKADIFENLNFPSGYWYEDSIISFLIWPQLKSAYTESHMFYNYRQNPKGIGASSHGQGKSIDTYWITEYLLEQRQILGLPYDDAFLRFMLHQIRLNYFRTKELDLKIQESIFVLTCNLMNHYFSDSTVNYQRNLQHALKNYDFGMFRACCFFPDF